MFGLYSFLDWNGEPRIMRASTIHKKVLESSKKSNYGWIASATDLITVCSKKNFPVEYAIDIKSAVLNCFSVLINSEDDTSKSKKTDIHAVYYAYNSLFGIENENAVNARKNFLNGFLHRIRWNSWQFMFHQGNSFNNVCKEWQNTKFNELIIMENLNFDELKKSLEEDFRKLIKKAEQAGVFIEDDKRNAKIQMRIIEESVNDFTERYGTKENPKVRKLTPPKNIPNKQ